VTQELSSADYARFVADEYLGDFVREGGSAVKVAVAADRAAAVDLSRRVLADAPGRGYVGVPVDAATTRISLVQQLFHAIAQAVSWREAAQEVVRRAARGHWGVEVDGAPTLERLGAATSLEPAVVRMEMQRRLQNEVYRDYGLAKDFRVAMLSYCAAELEPDVVGDQTRAVLGEWLRGELRLISAVKDRGIFQKIGRHNARVMVSSTARWLRLAGHSGLAVVVDVDRLAVARRNDLPDQAGLFYTQAHVMDAYEVVRQFIDATDEIDGCFILVVAPSPLLTDDRRGFEAYAALKNRIWDDVRDRSRPNPYAPMVRIAADERPDG